MLVRRATGWALRRTASPRRPLTSPTTIPSAAPRSSSPTASRAGGSVPPAGHRGAAGRYGRAAARGVSPRCRGAAVQVRAWAAVGLAEPDPAALARLLDSGFVGACVAAEALGGPEGFDRLGPVLETSSVAVRRCSSIRDGCRRLPPPACRAGGRRARAAPSRSSRARSSRSGSWDARFPRKGRDRRRKGVSRPERDRKQVPGTLHSATRTPPRHPQANPVCGHRAPARARMRGHA